MSILTRDPWDNNGNWAKHHTRHNEKAIRLQQSGSCSRGSSFFYLFHIYLSLSLSFLELASFSVMFRLAKVYKLFFLVVRKRIETRNARDEQLHQLCASRANITDLPPNEDIESLSLPLRSMTPYYTHRRLQLNRWNCNSSSKVIAPLVHRVWNI